MGRAGALLFALIVAPAAFGEQFLVEAELWLNGEPAGTPVLVVEAGEPASISRNEADGQDGWRLTFDVEPVAADPLAPSGSLWLQVDVQQQTEGTWQAVVDSILGVPEGETATFSVVDGADEPHPDTAAVYLRVKTSRLVEGGVGGRSQPDQ